MSTDWDSVVVGGGAAGLSAALVLGRARRRTLVLDRGGQSNLPAPHVGGLLAQEGTTPAELYERAHEQLRDYDTVEIRDAEALDARAEGEGFVVKFGDGGGEVSARTLILATGMDYEVPDVPDFREHWGNAVFHCPFCHGWEVRDQRLVVCGEGEMAEHQATLLRLWSDDVTVVDPAEVAGLRVEDGTLEALVRRDGSEVPCDAILVHAPIEPPREHPRAARSRADRERSGRDRRDGSHDRARRLRRGRPRRRAAAGLDRDGQRPPGRNRRRSGARARPRIAEPA